MIEVILCSNCFKDQGLRLDSYKIGIEDNRSCPNCKTKNGKKLNRELIAQLAHQFFVRGTVHKARYGAAPAVQFNEHHYKKTSIDASEWLKADKKLIEEAIKIGFFYYGPRLWMVGAVEPLKSLQRSSKRNEIIHKILAEYPTRILSGKETFYRVRKEPKYPADYNEYDSPLNSYAGKGRFDSIQLPVMYGSQDLEICVHECRVTIDDELFVATLCPTRNLNLLDLTELIQEDTSEFESLDMAVHMLFLAGKHSYGILRKIAFTAYSAGFDGLIFPSYFSLVRTGAMPFDTVYGISVRRIPSYKEHAKAQTIQNIALFGRPIDDGRVTVKCINRLVLNKVVYDVQFGPVSY